MTGFAPLPPVAPARRAMIDSQLRPSGVNEPWVLAAMARVPREDFLPESARAAAYIDRAVPLGEGRFLAPPLVHARLLAEAAPRPDDAALVVSEQAYLAALLGPMVASVGTIAPGAVGTAIAGGPFSLIIIDGAAEELPAALTQALADDGRLIAGIVDRGITRLAVARKSAGALAILPLADMAIPPLADFAAKPVWSF